MIKEILLAAANILETKGWCQGTLGNCEGNFCAMGAINVAVNHAYNHVLGNTSNAATDTRVAATTHLRLYLQSVGELKEVKVRGLSLTVAAWNDLLKQTAENVIKRIREAAEATV